MASDPTVAAKSARFCAYLNGSYNADREAFLDLSHRVLMFAVIMLGASSISAVMPQWGLPWVGVATAAIGAADLLLNLSVRARTASYLRKSYFEIAAKLEEGKLTPDQAQAEMLRLAAEEEPPYRAAHAVAENWASGAVYASERPTPCRVSFWRRTTRNIFRHGGHDFSVYAEPGLFGRFFGRRPSDNPNSH